MLFTKLSAIWHPDRFQGWGRKTRYFEGWYYKIISADEQHAMAFIPGISMGAKGDRHAFIQIMDGKACKAEYHHFEFSDFQASAHDFEIYVKDNYFSAKEMRINLPGIKGEISFENTTAWPKMLGAPGIMGWYSFVPFMECNHGIVSLNHRLEGSLQISGLDPTPREQMPASRSVNFSGGKGYIEKDWGRSFPRAYVWMQSNHFDQAENASLMASVAHIPWLGSYFAGFISGLWLEGKLYKFATYTRAKKFLKVEGDHVELIFRNPGSELRIWAKQAPGNALISPLSGEMKGKIQESLQATIRVELLEKGQRIFESTGRNAGLEVAGEVEVLSS